MNMARWEYKQVDLSEAARHREAIYGEQGAYVRLTAIEVMLNVYGGDGWELVVLLGSEPNTSLIFKRPKEESDA